MSLYFQGTSMLVVNPYMKTMILTNYYCANVADHFITQQTLPLKREA